MDISSLVPMTKLNVLKNIPFDSTYSDTVTFNTVAEQVAYFNGKIKYSYTNLTPIRLQNTIRLPIVADRLYDCNYIMFQNENFGDRWLYAFITSIDWIGVNRCDVHFELDVIQTWWFDWSFRSCFVEREHIRDDTIGSNFVDENLEHGLYVYNSYQQAGLNDTSKYHIILASTENKSGLPGGFFISNIYSGVVFNDYGQDYSSLNGRIDTLVSQNKKDTILAIFMCPEVLFNSTREPVDYSFSINRNFPLDGYTPKNNKLYTYPYNFALLTNGTGSGIELRYEFMKSNLFKVRANMGINLEAICFPANYAGINDNIMYKVGLKDFPMCPYTIDSYSAWLAQNQGFQALNLANTATSTLLGVGTATIAGAINPIAGAMSMAGTVANGIGNIASTLETNRVHESLPMASRGTGTGTAEFANGLSDFYVYNCSITAEYAKIIDDYFSMFGYATNEVKIPNINNRPSWNYVKLGNMKYYGSVPFEDMDKIKSIFINGITLWHGDWVGDYTRVNK